MYYVVLGQSSGEGNGTPLQYSCLENPIDRGAWKAAVHGVAEGRTRLSDFTFNFHLHALEKEMAIHSSVLAWRVPGTGEPGGLPSMPSSEPLLPSRPDQEGRKGSEEGVPENLSVPLEGDRDFGELC